MSRFGHYVPTQVSKPALLVGSRPTQAEREEFMSHVAANPELQHDLDSQMAMKTLADGWLQRLEGDLHAARTREAGSFTSPGVLLILVGSGLLLGWALLEVFVDQTVPAPVQLGTGGLMAGGLILLAQAIRHRLRTRKTDRYTEVIR